MKKAGNAKIKSCLSRFYDNLYAKKWYPEIKHSGYHFLMENGSAAP